MRRPTRGDLNVVSLEDYTRQKPNVSTRVMQADPLIASFTIASAWT